MKIIRGKKALVTGAGSGIGRAIALALAREGADLCLIDIDATTLNTTAHEVRECGVATVTRVCDLARSNEISAAVAFLRETWRSLNILVNNAGIAYRGATHGMSAEQWDRIIAVNLLAPIQLTRELLPMLQANEAHVVNVCSIFGLITTRKATAYQTTKFGLVGFTSALRTEYGGPHFGVTTLCPGFVRTAMMESVLHSEPHKAPPSWMYTSPETVAAKAVAAIYSNKGILVITPVARAGWWLTRLSPGLVDWLARRAWRHWFKPSASDHG
jgi:3-oxoacyl-[acyl-carrier protein] reductase